MELLKSSSRNRLKSVKTLKHILKKDKMAANLGHLAI